MSATRPTPDLATVITDAFAVGAFGMRVALPGRVESYDAATQTCSATPLVQDGVKDETGTRQVRTLEVVQNAPVIFPGAGSYSITWPLAPGDTVLLVFASSAIDRWLALGGVVDPIDDRRHHLTDAVAIAGLRDLGHALGTTATDPGALVVAAPAIKLGSSAASNAVLTTVDATALNTAVEAAITAATNAPDPVAVAVLGFLYAAMGSAVQTWALGSSKVKADT